MQLISSVVRRIQRDYFRWRYNQVASQILATRSVPQGKLPFLLLSMVHQRDIQSYLVAVKSFVRFANPSRIVVVCDPSITDADRAILKKHVPHLELRAAAEFAHAQVPVGGTWERLQAISQYVRDEYVIQLDADTVTMHAIPEVLEAISNCKGFVLGETPNQRLLTLAETSANALPKVVPGSHIQTLSEAAMSSVGLPENALYVRGCSGFTGFPCTSRMQEDLLDFSLRMMERLGTGWERWGTEQVTSNYLVANANGTSVLPFPKYGTPDHATGETAFFHFIGSMRFVNNKYEKASQKVLHLIGTAVQ
ncbi:glycosyl transferase family 2 [Paucimonas lemoignei]|uniref:Glycosyl transferase family 2 n=1 Tax=Paucimonas lemoignei TaxID=29443 RepID=A0A4R3I1R4_PAULE|nr:glycosyltransferase family A protein [Paucimonas lemoignei]TCS38555.1 glycosyl transferase family 2 [Paucimonas lemoignei]